MSGPKSFLGVGMPGPRSVLGVGGYAWSQVPSWSWVILESEPPSGMVHP